MDRRISSDIRRRRANSSPKASRSSTSSRRILAFRIRPSWLEFARSGNTFDVRAGTDLNRDSVNNDRPPFVGRNTHKGPGSVQLDTRYARFFRFGGRDKRQLLAEAANLLNRPNPDATNASVSHTCGTGETPVATFGQVIRFREMRRVQLGVRFDF